MIENWSHCDFNPKNIFGLDPSFFFLDQSHLILPLWSDSKFKKAVVDKTWERIITVIRYSIFMEAYLIAVLKRFES